MSEQLIRQDAATQSVIVFGAGEAGRLALACLRREPGWNIVAFADEGQRAGGMFEGLPVVPAASLRTSSVERIVVATQSAVPAVTRLRALGVAASRIDVYQPAQDAIAPLAGEEQSWPRILLITDAAISPSHGIGVTLLRHFDGYSRERLVHAYVGPHADACLPLSFRVAPASAIAAGASGAIERPALSASQLTSALGTSFGRVDLVYSNCSTEAGVLFVWELLETLKTSVPVVHHVHDRVAQSDDRFDALLRAVAPRITELWANGPALASRVRRATRREVVELNTTSCTIVPHFKREHRALSPDFTAVMLGGSRMPWVLDKLRAVWAQVRLRHGVGPIRWYAHPDALIEVEQAGVRVGSDIEYIGYLSEPVLYEQLCAADLGIVPFNMADEAEPGYPRYSIPSRLGPLLGAGLPVFAAAGRNTETSRFIRQHGIGRCSTIADTDRFTEDLLAIVSDAAARKALGHAARMFAAAHCDRADDRRRILARIGALTHFDFTNALPIAA